MLTLRSRKRRWHARPWAHLFEHACSHVGYVVHHHEFIFVEIKRRCTLAGCDQERLRRDIAREVEVVELRTLGRDLLVVGFVRIDQVDAIIGRRRTRGENRSQSRLRVGGSQAVSCLPKELERRLKLTCRRDWRVE